MFDLGYSLNQIKDPKKGMSFEHNSKLNMRLGLNKFSADDVINKMKRESLYKIFKIFGEEKKSKIISNLIFKKRAFKELNTQDLVSIINYTYKGKKKKIHNATKIFQALRIFVNKEISELIYGLVNAYKILPIGGVILVVSFHSLEDKITKFFFKNYSKNENNSRYLPIRYKNEPIFKTFTNKPITPNQKEIKINPPSRSAKLRYAIKIKENQNFDELINKFSYLLDIENLDKEI